MPLVTILRELLRLRWFVIGALLLSLGAAAGLTLKRPSYTVGIASATALVDSPSSQVVDLGGGQAGADVGTLTARANLLASLMTSEPLKDEIAKRAGIDPKMLLTPGQQLPGAGSASAQVSGAAITESDPRASILRTSVATQQSGQVPVIAVDTRAPDAAGAAKLADTAITVVQSQIKSVAGTQRVPATRRLVVQPLGRATSALETHGPSRVMAAALAILLFGFLSFVIVSLAWFKRAWKATADGATPEPFFGGPTATQMVHPLPGGAYPPQSVVSPPHVAVPTGMSPNAAPAPPSVTALAPERQPTTSALDSTPPQRRPGAPRGGLRVAPPPPPPPPPPPAAQAQQG
jgi:hypothetical protein